MPHVACTTIFLSMRVVEGLVHPPGALIVSLRNELLCSLSSYFVLVNKVELIPIFVPSTPLCCYSSPLYLVRFCMSFESLASLLFEIFVSAFLFFVVNHNDWHTYVPIRAVVSWRISYYLISSCIFISQMSYSTSLAMSLHRIVLWR